MNKKEEWCGARLKMKVVKFFSYISQKIPKFVKKNSLKLLFKKKYDKSF